jgi:hypothetical protein
MGLYSINCPACKQPHVWFSGSMDQRCDSCKKPREWYIQEASEGYNEFVTTLTPEELEKYHPDVVKERDDAGRWHHVIEKSAFDFQSRQASEIAEEFNKLAKSHAALQDIWEKQYLELEAVRSQLLTEKAEVGRLLALNKRRSKS